MQGRSTSIATDTVCLSVKSDTIATESKIASSRLYGSDSDSGDKSKNDDESLPETYEKMYTQWLKVCVTN